MQAATEDMRFIGVDGGMWEDYQTDTYDDSRVKLELDVTSPHVMRYVGERNLNRANVVFTSNDKATTDKDAQLLNGIYRADFKDNDGGISQDNAVYEVSICGMGAFKLATKFVDEDDPENEDQEIIFKPITNAFNHVVFDETATRIDKADAKRVTVLTPHSPDSFAEQWPDASQVSAPHGRQFSRGFQWFTREVIYTATRYQIKTINDPVEVWRNVVLNEVKAFTVKDLDDDEQGLRDELKLLGWEYVRTRKLKRQTVWQTVFSGDEILEKEKRIAGKYLPIIPMYGVRTYIDNKENFRGLVRKLKDSNRALNSGVSRMSEDASSTGTQIPILWTDEATSEVAKNSWKDPAGNSMVIVDPVDDGNGGRLPKTIPFMPTSQIDPNTMGLIEVVSNFVQRETGNAPQDQVDPDASGKAIDALEDRQNLTTQLITDNILQSVKHEGKVYLSMAADIYTKSQMKKTIGVDGKSIKFEQLKHHTLDPQTGNPITLNDLSRGRFSVDVEVGTQYESQKAATIGSIERVIEKVGEQSPLQPALVGAWVENIEGTGLEGVKKVNRDLML
ncbi:MAG: hypothetical protein GY941_18075, partial [Planctomycetes bacterium]|nr:hypothetical protein [Planctomycetota bacterium]